MGQPIANRAMNKGGRPRRLSYADLQLTRLPQPRRGCAYTPALVEAEHAEEVATIKAQIGSTHHQGAVAAAGERTIIQMVCAWCGADLGTKDGQGKTGTSHGICAQCYPRLLAGEDPPVSSGDPQLLSGARGGSDGASPSPAPRHRSPCLAFSCPNCQPDKPTGFLTCTLGKTNIPENMPYCSVPINAGLADRTR